jgi:hypothetical protein
MDLVRTVNGTFVIKYGAQMVKLRGRFRRQPLNLRHHRDKLFLPLEDTIERPRVDRPNGIHNEVVGALYRKKIPSHTRSFYKILVLEWLARIMHALVESGGRQMRTLYTETCCQRPHCRVGHSQRLISNSIRKVIVIVPYRCRIYRMSSGSEGELVVMIFILPHGWAISASRRQTPHGVGRAPCVKKAHEAREAPHGWRCGR